MGPAVVVHLPGETCAGFTALEMRELLEEADTVLKDEGVPAMGEHERLTRHISSRIPGATFIIELDLIGELCVTSALREHYGDSHWRGWMTTARRIEPDYWRLRSSMAERSTWACPGTGGTADIHGTYGISG